MNAWEDRKMTNLKNGSHSNDARDVSVARVDMKLEVIVIPVSDAERAEQFYRKHNDPRRQREGYIQALSEQW
jgi:hypothetical protein